MVASLCPSLSAKVKAGLGASFRGLTSCLEEEDDNCSVLLYRTSVQASSCLELPVPSATPPPSLPAGPVPEHSPRKQAHLPCPSAQIFLSVCLFCLFLFVLFLFVLLFVFVFCLLVWSVDFCESLSFSSCPTWHSPSGSDPAGMG